MSDEISQAEMDKFFETQGKEVPQAIVQAEKVEAEAPEQPKEAKVEVQAEPKPELPKVEPKPDGEVQVQVEGKTVPLSELIAERKARQEWQTTAAQQQQQLTETLNMLKERTKALPQAEQELAPDPSTDPIAYHNWAIGKLAMTVQEMQGWKTQQEQQNQAATRSQQLMNWANTQAQAFSQQEPKFNEAYAFAREGRSKELAAIGIPTESINAALEKEQAEIVMFAAQTGKNPAQLIYDYAKARGFKAEIVAEQKKIPDLDDKVKTISKGQDAAKGLSGTSGGAPSEINSLADLAAASGDLDDDAFSKAFDKLVPKMKGKYV